MQIQQKLPSLVKPSFLNGLLNLEHGVFAKKFRIIEANPGVEFKESYLNAHIPKAVFLNTMECTNATKMHPRAVPNKECFADYAGSLGISNKHHLIVYDRSPFGFYASSRMWWIFRLFGHENVSILDGGLRLWASQSFDISGEVTNFEKEKFQIKENKSLLRNYDDVTQNIESKKEVLIDVRPSEDFNKTDPDNNRPNNIPNSVNLPYGEFFDRENGTLKSLPELKELFESRKVDLAKPAVASCMTGMTACTLAYVAHLVQNVQMPVYGGSWTEYSQRRN